MTTLAAEVRHVSKSFKTGPATVRARATDSSGMTTTADPVAVDVKADYPTLVLDDGAVAYWRLNDGGRGAYDWTGTGHRAYYLGPTTRTAPLIGEGGRSATFDGVDDIIAVADHRDLNTAASYQVKLRSGFEAKRPNVRSASERLSSSNRKMYRSPPFTKANTLMS